MVGSPRRSYLKPFSRVLHAAFARAEGQALIEFGLIIALVSMVTLGTVSMTGSSVTNVIGGISGSVSGAQTGVMAPTTTTPTTTAPAPPPPKGKKKKKTG